MLIWFIVLFVFYLFFVVREKDKFIEKNEYKLNFYLVEMFILGRGWKFFMVLVLLILMFFCVCYCW